MPHAFAVPAGPATIPVRSAVSVVTASEHPLVARYNTQERPNANDRNVRVSGKPASSGMLGLALVAIVLPSFPLRQPFAPPASFIRRDHCVLRQIRLSATKTLSGETQ